MASNSPAVVVEVRRGTMLVKSAQFSEPSVTIGRSASAMFPVDAPELADLHAVLNVEDDGSVSLLDLGSPEGVSVNGQRIANTTLRSGDAFQVGALTFRITVFSAGADEFEDESATKVESVRPPSAAPASSAAVYTAPRQSLSDVDDRTEEKQDLPQGPTAQMHTSPAYTATSAMAGGAAHGDEHTAGESASGDAGDHGIGHDQPYIDTFEDDHDDHHDDDEDVLAFVMRTNPGQVTKKAKFLEVNQMWGNVLVDTRQFAPEGRNVTVGASLGYRWRLLGVDMGWVNPGLGRVLPAMMPMWSDVGREWQSDFYVPTANLPNEQDFTLFTHPEPGKYVANVASGWDGFVDVEDRRYTFDELVAAGKATRAASGGYEVPMTEDMRLTVEAGGHMFFAQLAGHDPRLVARLTDDVDYPFMGMIAFGLFVFATIGATMYFMPPMPENNTNEVDERALELMLQKPEEEKKEAKKPDANPDAGEGAKAKKEEGKVGKKEAKLDKAKGNKVEVKQQEIDRQVAETAGVLGAMNNGNIDQVLGASGLSSDLRGGIGGLIGAKGSQIGSGGLGARGGGLGGGGTAEGLGGLGTKGMGSGASGYGKGGGNFGAKGEGGIGAVSGDPIILGALDRSLIDEVIKRNMNAIRYCYQRELTKNPSLGGKIVIKFVIAKDGTVSSAEKKTTTMNNGAVEQCIVGRFMRMQFPEPKGGGIVIVSYPFIFSPG